MTQIPLLPRVDQPPDTHAVDDHGEETIRTPRAPDAAALDRRPNTVTLGLM